jgi:hypothetical protein
MLLWRWVKIPRCRWRRRKGNPVPVDMSRTPCHWGHTYRDLDARLTTLRCKKKFLLRNPKKRKPDYIRHNILRKAMAQKGQFFQSLWWYIYIMLRKQWRTLNRNCGRKTGQDIKWQMSMRLLGTLRYPLGVRLLTSGERRPGVPDIATFTLQGDSKHPPTRWHTVEIFPATNKTEKNTFWNEVFPKPVAWIYTALCSQGRAGIA